MNPNSRDNVNPQASVTIEAIDREGNVVDRHTSYGRHEPATQLLDFMLNCEAMFGKPGTKIVRFTCEIAYILLVGLIFLSSGRVEASHGDPSHTICCNVQRVVSSVSSVNPAYPMVHPTGSSYKTPWIAPPILYVIKWPPVKSEAERMAKDAHEQVTKVMMVEPVKVKPFDWHKVLEWIIYVTVGWAALLCGAVYLMWQRNN